MEDRKVLNLEWVTDIVGMDYKEWEYGDTVTIEAQTGTGKTYFITGSDKAKGLVDKMSLNENMLYLCNRTELKNQIKHDLLKKYNMKIPYLKDEEGNILLDEKGKEILDKDALEKIYKIGNVVINSYHRVAEKNLDNVYLEEEYNLDYFDYIVCDECHFFLTDGGFNSTTDYSFNEIIEKNHPNSIKIFISATMDEIKDEIINYHDIECGKLHHYSTGKDYSYLNVKYFNKIDNITTLIKNDKSDDRWLIFVTNKNKGEEIKEKLDSYNISNSFITAKNKGAESKNILQNSKFESKVLISTKCLDNGVNIKDLQLKNLVVMAYDRTTFIQEIGRLRFDIKKPAPKINLYINTCYKKTFTSQLEMIHNPKVDKIKLLKTNEDLFCRNFDNANYLLPSDIFSSTKGKGWKINRMGQIRLKKDIEFCKYIIKKFENDYRYAYVKEQLKWLGLEGTFDEMNMIEDVLDNEEIQTLKQYLDSLVGQKILDDEQNKISDFIKTEFNNVSNKIDYRTKKASVKTLNSILENDLKLNYFIVSTKTSKRIDGKPVKYTYWTIIRTKEVN